MVNHLFYLFGYENILKLSELRNHGGDIQYDAHAMFDSLLQPAMCHHQQAEGT